MTVTEDLLGTLLLVVVSEGAPPLKPELELIGRVTQVGPAVGSPTGRGVLFDITEPPDSALIHFATFIYPRYEGGHLEEALEGKTVVVNLNLHDPAKKLIAQGTGVLEPVVSGRN